MKQRNEGSALSPVLFNIVMGYNTKDPQNQLHGQFHTRTKLS